MKHAFRLTLIVVIVLLAGEAFRALILHRPNLAALQYGRDMDGDAYPEAIDCNDANGEINPGAEEHCGDNVDNDCDGAIDAADSSVVLNDYCFDGNRDGHCDEDADGHQIEFSLCEDVDYDVVRAFVKASGGDPSTITHFARMTDDRHDEATYCCVDRDNDGFGRSADCVYEPTGECTDPGRVLGDGDCDDANASTNPDEDDSVGDDVDSNCDGEP